MWGFFLVQILQVSSEGSLPSGANRGLSSSQQSIRDDFLFRFLLLLASFAGATFTAALGFSLEATGFGTTSEGILKTSRQYHASNLLLETI